ncbi:hypothetical protein [Streptomyces sp. PA5.6]|uniref:hypothetical protein n=1 Tax=Streptomyces sp. PA5.6 TaxID=3035651 RepID=UPI003904A865
MDSPKVTAIILLFTATLETEPRQDQSGNRIRVEAQVPASLSEPARIKILRLLLESADRFGHSVHRDGTSVIWAEIDLHT